MAAQTLKTMQTMMANRSLILWLTRIALCAALLTGASAYAEDSKAGAAGTWTWTAPGRNGGADRTNSLVVKVENSKLTGKLSAPGRGGQVSEVSISDGKVDGDKISFTIVREFNGNSITNKYTGKVEGDKIQGKVRFTRDGEDQSRDWQASRSTAAK
jgi:hypothetical protein